MGESRNFRQPNLSREILSVSMQETCAPADARLLEKQGLHVRESVLTGESLPVEKTVADLTREEHGVADASNSVFLGTAVQTGIGTAVIVCTGKDTACGEIANRLAMRPPETEFGRGIRHFGMMLTWVTMLLVLLSFW